jgi:hypothetical protein
MATAAVSDAIRAPYAVVDAAFRAAASCETLSAPTSWPRAVSAAFAAAVASDEALASVPPLNALSPPGTLVRVCGVVRDVFDPEMFAQALLESIVEASGGQPEVKRRVDE